MEVHEPRVCSACGNEFKSAVHHGCAITQPSCRIVAQTSHEVSKSQSTDVLLACHADVHIVIQGGSESQNGPG